MSQPAKKFNVGDNVTYKDRNNCLNEFGFKKYYFGGVNQNNYVGIIKDYSSFNKERNCFRIIVTNKLRATYLMLEDEFLEFNNNYEIY